MLATIVVGAEDRCVSPRANSTRLHAEVPGSELVVVPGAGHMVHHVATERVAETTEALSFAV